MIRIAAKDKAHKSIFKSFLNVNHEGRTASKAVNKKRTRGACPLENQLNEREFYLLPPWSLTRRFNIIRG